MRRGDVRWYKFSPPDKQRPVVLLTRDAILQYLGDVTVAPITTTIRDIPSEVRLYKEDGMLQDCAVNCDHIQNGVKEPSRCIADNLVLWQNAGSIQRHRLRVESRKMRLWHGQR